MKMSRNEKLNTTPDAKDIWLGIAGHFDEFSQVLCEFIDNSIAVQIRKMRTLAVIL